MKSAQTIGTFVIFLSLIITGRSQNITKHDNPTKRSQFCGSVGSTITSETTTITSKPVQHCQAPSQPNNGQRTLHGLQCESGQNCDLGEGVELYVGTLLVYSCYSGYKLIGSEHVFCGMNGTWSNIPECVEIRCKSLSSASTVADCTYNTEKVSCDVPVLPQTRAFLSCRIGYYQPEIILSGETDVLTCNTNGTWDETPIRCFPECGRLNIPSVDPSTNDIHANISEFPWHASLYKATMPDAPKEFICGATIIQESLLITAAHCVYDEISKQAVEANKFYVATGNIHQEYDSPFHDTRIVKKATVKNTYIPCRYLGLDGNYASDIAIIEINTPLVFSNFLSPVCFDTSQSTSQYTFQLGSFGKLAAFPQKSSSSILQSFTVPYISYNQCKSLSSGRNTQTYITIDKFCTGYVNATPACTDYVGGNGLVFIRNVLWYLDGVSSVSLGEIHNGTLHCHTYDLYTHVYSHATWIKNVLELVKRRQSPDQDASSKDSELCGSINSSVTPSSTSTLSMAVQCQAPPQPNNGQWKLHGSQCESGRNCDVGEGIEFQTGTLLVYSCYPGYKVRGSVRAFCGTNGTWLNIPECIEIRCKSLSTVSTGAVCTYNDEWIDCDTPVLPQTTALLSCRKGYHRITTTFSREKGTLRCNINGQWDAKPIRCILDCGRSNIPSIDLRISGTRTNFTEFPWHASLYTATMPGAPKEFICGATIIQESLLITAAHCVYDEISKQAVEANKFYVATGNIHQEYDSPFHDTQIVKKATVKNTYIPCHYLGLNGNYASDIAIIEISTPLVFSNLLSPVCLDIVQPTLQDTFFVGSSGKFLGFSSSGLQTITEPYVSFTQCKSNIAPDAERYLTFDKFCTGYRNATATCVQYGGSGLVFKRNELWYLQGVQSLHTGIIYKGNGAIADCQSYVLYTRVYNHIQWIQEILALEQHSSETSDEANEEFDVYVSSTETPTVVSVIPHVTHRKQFCRAPPQPQNGHWELSSNVDARLELYPSGTSLRYSCDSGYNVTCVDVYCTLHGVWSKTCECIEVRCKPLTSDKGLVRPFWGECMLNNKWVSCDSYVLPQTIARLHCRHNYYQNTMTPSRQNNVLKCNDNGQWDAEPIDCVPGCGFTHYTLTPFIVNGAYARINDFPWHATLYTIKSPDAPKEFICGATVIQDNLLITAAHCVYDEPRERVQEANKFYIATGNTFQEYDSPYHDFAVVQRSQVKKISVNSHFVGAKGNYASDIAIIQIITPFNLTGFTVPVCWDTLSDEHVLFPGNQGRVAGFGRTVHNSSSSVLQSLIVNYVSDDECKSFTNRYNNENLITADKFCAGYLNGSSVCSGDSGGGLVFQSNELWYLRGVVSVGIGKPVIVGCDSHGYTGYTRLYKHIDFIKHVMNNL